MMTTPERIRRRQRIETAAVLIVMFLALGNSVYFNQRADEGDKHAKDQRDCLISYAVTMTDALQDRDAIAVVTRTAALELWDAIDAYVTSPPVTVAARQHVLRKAIREYTRALRVVSKANRLNPYPDPTECLQAIGADALGYELAAATATSWPHIATCWGRPVTIYGTRYPDIIHGTDGPDVILSYGGGDLIVTGGGNDRVCARRGWDFINTGTGYDRAGCGRGWDHAQQAERTRWCE